MSLAPVRVIFACVHNAGRSQMAAAFFTASADPKLAIAVSAGTHPGRVVHPEVVAAMSEIGFDLSEATPQQLTVDLAADATYVITMGCGDACPVMPSASIEDWPFPDPKGQPTTVVRNIRDTIRARVEDWIDAQGWRRGQS